MYVLVRQSFTIGKKVHHRGDVLLVLDAELKEELPSLLREGVIVVYKRPRSPVQLATPESGQRLTCR